MSLDWILVALLCGGLVLWLVLRFFRAPKLIVIPRPILGILNAAGPQGESQANQDLSVFREFFQDVRVSTSVPECDV